MVRRQSFGMTRFSTIHPYPAMIADPLAQELAEAHVGPSSRFLDPFCGTGRTVMAAIEQGAKAVGYDVNPLAVLIARAKSRAAGLKEVKSVLATAPGFIGGGSPEYDLQPCRKVQWFSNDNLNQLGEIIRFLNATDMSNNCRTLLAVVLSATAREVSYCRKGQWKLHRMGAGERQHHLAAAWPVFSRRCQRVMKELETTASTMLTARIHQVNSLNASDSARILGEAPFNVVITSPPYGDSKTTVSYGDVSSLCLGVLQHVAGIKMHHMRPKQIDDLCLGGKRADRKHNSVEVRKYWAGSRSNPGRARAERFLVDVRDSCLQLDSLLDRRSTVVYVISRRSVSGRRVYVDRLLSDTMASIGFQLSESRTRTIIGKLAPLVVNSHARSSEETRIKTMREEIVLCFKRRDRLIG